MGGQYVMLAGMLLNGACFPPLKRTAPPRITPIFTTLHGKIHQRDFFICFMQSSTFYLLLYFSLGKLQTPLANLYPYIIFVEYFLNKPQK